VVPPNEFFMALPKLKEFTFNAGLIGMGGMLPEVIFNGTHPSIEYLYAYCYFYSHIREDVNKIITDI